MLYDAMVSWWNGTRNWELWGTLAWYDVVLKYRRSVLGPLWITISTGALVLCMGPLYAGLFGQSLRAYFPHLALGVILWNYMSSSLNDGCNAFINGARFLKQPGFPDVAIVWHSLAKNTIQLAHTLLIYIPVKIFFGLPITLSVAAFLGGFVVTVVNLHAASLTLGVISARYRDLSQVVSTGLTLAMFLTPVFWVPDSLPTRARIILFNPLSQLLNAMRQPLLGSESIDVSWGWIGTFTVLNIVVALAVYTVCRRKLVFWV